MTISLRASRSPRHLRTSLVALIIAALWLAIPSAQAAQPAPVLTVNDNVGTYVVPFASEAAMYSDPVIHLATGLTPSSEGLLNTYTTLDCVGEPSNSTAISTDGIGHWTLDYSYLRGQLPRSMSVTDPTTGTSNCVTLVLEVPPTAIPPTEVPPTEVPPTEVPPTEVPPTEIPPTEVPPTEVPPTEIPPTEIPPTEIPPTEVPPTEVPPTEVPPTNGPTTPTPTATATASVITVLPTTGGNGSDTYSSTVLASIIGTGALLLIASVVVWHRKTSR